MSIIHACMAVVHVDLKLENVYDESKVDHNSMRPDSGKLKIARLFQTLSQLQYSIYEKRLAHRVCVRYP